MSPTPRHDGPSTAYPHGPNCPGCREMRVCNLCAAPISRALRGTVGRDPACTNGHCPHCHSRACTAGGSTSPGHGPGSRQRRLQIAQARPRQVQVVKVSGQAEQAFSDFTGACHEAGFPGHWRVRRWGKGYQNRVEIPRRDVLAFAEFLDHGDTIGSGGEEGCNAWYRATVRDADRIRLDYRTTAGQDVAR